MFEVIIIAVLEFGIGGPIVFSEKWENRIICEKRVEWLLRNGYDPMVLPKPLTMHVEHKGGCIKVK